MKNAKHLPKILFFVADSVPSPDEYKAAEALNGNVVFRNVNFVPETGALEECDSVAGIVPKSYSHLACEAEKQNSELKQPEQKSQTIIKQTAPAAKTAAPVWQPNK